VALQIQTRQPTVASQRELEDAVKQLVQASYQLDSYGDLGDAPKIAAAYQRFSAAVAAIRSKVEGRR
jgi:hypothetical protein